MILSHKNGANCPCCSIFVFLPSTLMWTDLSHPASKPITDCSNDASGAATLHWCQRNENNIDAFFFFFLKDLKISDDCVKNDGPCVPWPPSQGLKLFFCTGPGPSGTGSTTEKLWEASSPRSETSTWSTISGVGCLWGWSHLGSLVVQSLAPTS